ncbi:MAG: hypothetical protein EOO96_30005 [Pedobacter sp.]|nr:MAG: hypothetical protein EOO96_30005 [Pedobacter sp.]
MKNSLKILAGALVLFGIITWATCSLHYNADGADEYGFPLNFYTKVSGYNLETQQGGTAINFDFFALLGDVVFALVLSILIFKITTKYILNATKHNH